MNDGIQALYQLLVKTAEFRDVKVLNVPGAYRIEAWRKGGNNGYTKDFSFSWGMPAKNLDWKIAKAYMEFTNNILRKQEESYEELIVNHDGEPIDSDDDRKAPAKRRRKKRPGDNDTISG